MQSQIPPLSFSLRWSVSAVVAVAEPLAETERWVHFTMSLFLKSRRIDTSRGVWMRMGTVVALVLVGKDACEEDWKRIADQDVQTISNLIFSRRTNLSNIFI